MRPNYCTWQLSPPLSMLMGEMKTPSSRQVGEGWVSDAAVVAEHTRLKSSRRDVLLPPNRGGDGDSSPACF